jgi:redox-sensitive bicupin YhaK (pirin superfamily)
LGAQIDLVSGAAIVLDLDPVFEHGVLAGEGSVAVDGVILSSGALAYHGCGRASVRVINAGAGNARVLLLGGTPFTEELVMWWNFIGRSHEDIVRFRTEWQEQVIEGGRTDGRFGAVSDYDGRPLPAPEMPTVRLKPRD